MSDENDYEVQRVVPQSGLDFNMMQTDTVWGDHAVGHRLMRKMRLRVLEKEQDKVVSEMSRDDRLELLNKMREDPEAFTKDKAPAWELLSFYTRDMRLANLNPLFGETEYCQHYIDLAGDCLREGYPEAFATSLSRSATVLELSQSKGGFLRKRQNTLTQESVSMDGTKKKSLLGGSRRQG